MKILVTGGSGFVGKNLIPKLLQDGHEVTFPTRAEVDLAYYNPTQKSLTQGQDVLIHLASIISLNEMFKHPQETIVNNINATLNLLEDLRLNNPHGLFIFLSSEKVYGYPEDKITKNGITGNGITKNGITEGGITEEQSPLPVEPYGASKLASELFIKSYHHNYGINYFILRAANIFGPGQHSESFLPSVINKIITAPEQVTYGNLEIYRNFIYIEDLLSAILKCLNNFDQQNLKNQTLKNQTLINQIFNLSAYNFKIAEIFKKIIILAQEKNINPQLVQDHNLFRPSEILAKKYTLNCEKARTLLNWKPQYTFEEALKNTFESYFKK